MAHLSSSIALAGCLLLGARVHAAPETDHAEGTLESRLRAEVAVPVEAPRAPQAPLRVLPKLRDAKVPEPIPLKVQRDASAGVRI